jgi:hypothetical protein
MHLPIAHRRTAYPGGGMDSLREGRDCERSRRLTALLLFPRLDAVPGPWLVFLASVCTFVAVRALELGYF